MQAHPPERETRRREWEAKASRHRCGLVGVPLFRGAGTTVLRAPGPSSHRRRRCTLFRGFYFVGQVRDTCPPSHYSSVRVALFEQSKAKQSV